MNSVTAVLETKIAVIQIGSGTIFLILFMSSPGKWEKNEITIGIGTFDNWREQQLFKQIQEDLQKKGALDRYNGSIFQIKMILNELDA